MSLPEQAWIDMERALVAASLSEIAPSDARDRMCAALSAHLGAECTLRTGHHPAGDDADALLVGSSIEDTASTLLLPRGAAIDAETRERLKRLFELLLQAAHPVRQGARTLHKLRNRLAGLQTNIEFVEMVISNTGAEDLGADFPRADVETSLTHAITVCRDMAKTLRALSGLDEP